MHYHHEILVKADSREDAISAAEYAIEPYGEGDVWDWYVIGGRMSGFHTKMKTGEWPEPRDQYREDSYRDDALCYADDPDLFRACIEDQLDAQRQNLQSYLERLTENQKRRLASGDLEISHDDCGEYGLLGHYLYHIGKLMAGYYESGSYFFNAEWSGPEMPEEMWEEVESQPAQWWLVTVDLHN